MNYKNKNSKNLLSLAFKMEVILNGVLGDLVNEVSLIKIIKINIIRKSN